MVNLLGDIAKDKGQPMAYTTYYLLLVNNISEKKSLHTGRRVETERQRRWPEALFLRLATLPHSDFFPLNYETIVDSRDAKWFIYIRMPLYPSISISTKYPGSVFCCKDLDREAW